MPGPKALQIELSAQERSKLEQLVRRHSTKQRIALRARLSWRVQQASRIAKSCGQKGCISRQCAYGADAC
jgi:hypothetical protein